MAALQSRGYLQYLDLVLHVSGSPSCFAAWSCHSEDAPGQDQVDKGQGRVKQVQTIQMKGTAGQGRQVHGFKRSRPSK